MRFNRCKIDSRSGAAVYACASSALAEWKPFEGDGLDVFKSILFKVSEFTGVWVDTYAINAREFQVQVYVPQRPDLLDAEIFRRYKELNSPPSAYMKAEIEKVEKMFHDHDEAGIKHWANSKSASMYDVSGFMKLVKERFAAWFNRTTGRDGPLFTSRFSSTMVEATKEWMSGTCAAIDSIQFAASRLEDENQVLCTGFGDAVSGNELARRGIMRALEGESWEAIAAEYQALIAKHCELEPPLSFDVVPLSEWLKSVPSIDPGMEGGLVRILEDLCGAVVWGGMKFTTMACNGYLRQHRKMRARRELGLVSMPGSRVQVAVMRKINRNRQQSPG